MSRSAAAKSEGCLRAFAEGGILTEAALPEGRMWMLVASCLRNITRKLQPQMSLECQQARDDFDCIVMVPSRWGGRSGFRFRLPQQLDEIVLPDGGLRVRAMAACCIGDGD